MIIVSKSNKSLLSCDRLQPIKSYPSLIGLDESKKVATDLIKEAKDSIRKISGESRFLEDLADYIISRDH